jgi:hypothetical protein
VASDPPWRWLYSRGTLDLALAWGNGTLPLARGTFGCVEAHHQPGASTVQSEIAGPFGEAQSVCSLPELFWGTDGSLTPQIYRWTSCEGHDMAQKRFPRRAGTGN